MHTNPLISSLWLSSHISKIEDFSDKLFSSVYICSIIFKSVLWAGQSFNNTFISQTQLCCMWLWHKVPSCWKVLFSSKSGIKSSSSNWMYLAQFKLLSILTSFLKLLLYVSLKLLFSLSKMGCFAFLEAYLCTLKCYIDFYSQEGTWRI